MQLTESHHQHQNDLSGEKWVSCLMTSYPSLDHVASVTHSCRFALYIMTLTVCNPTLGTVQPMVISLQCPSGGRLHAHWNLYRWSRLRQRVRSSINLKGHVTPQLIDLHTLPTAARIKFQSRMLCLQSVFWVCTKWQPTVTSTIGFVSCRFEPLSLTFWAAPCWFFEIRSNLFFLTVWAWPTACPVHVHLHLQPAPIWEYQLSTMLYPRPNAYGALSSIWLQMGPSFTKWTIQYM